MEGFMRECDHIFIADDDNQIICSICLCSDDQIKVVTIQRVSDSDSKLINTLRDPQMQDWIDQISNF